MPGFSLVFNKLQVEIPAKKLSLSVESSIFLQSFHGNAQTMKTKQRLDLLYSGKTWVTRGVGCRIDFIILTNEQPDRKPAIKKMIEDFAYCVRDAPLWSEVSLQAELNFLERDASQDSDLNFSLILRHPLLDCIPGHSDSAPDVQVPAGIPCFQLRRVKIAMTFNIEIPCKISPSLLPFPSSESEFERKYGPKHELERLSRFQMPYTVAMNNSQATHSVSKFYFDTLPYYDHEMLWDGNFLSDVDFVRSMEVTNPLSKSWQFLPSRPNSSENEAEYNPVTRRMDSVLSDLGCTRELADIAFRKLVGGRHDKVPAGIKFSLGRPTLTLSKLAPGLFSPGFTEAMSQRSKFIPTISHALSVSLLRNAQSPSLRRKLLSIVPVLDEPSDNDNIGRPFQDRSKPSRSSKIIPSRTLRDTVERRLWTMMQDSLYHPASTSRILPSQDLNPDICKVKAAGHTEMYTSRSKSSGGVIKGPSSFPGYGSDFSSEDFEDLSADTEDYHDSENIFSNDVIDRIMHGDFEDLLEGRSEHNGSDKGFEKYNMHVDMIVDETFQDQRKTNDLTTIYPLHYYSSGKHDIADLENEDMLI